VYEAVWIGAVCASAPSRGFGHRRERDELGARAVRARDRVDRARASHADRARRQMSSLTPNPPPWRAEPSRSPRSETPQCEKLKIRDRGTLGDAINSTMLSRVSIIGSLLLDQHPINAPCRHERNVCI